MEDTIKVVVYESLDNVVEYETTYEQFAEISRILKEVNSKKKLTTDEISQSNPTALLELFSKSLSFGSTEKPLIYDLSEKPDNFSIEEIIAKFKKEKVVLVESKGKKTINTKLTF